MEKTLFPQMGQYGFAPIGDSLCVGTWKNYAVTLRYVNGKTYYVYVALRVDSARSALRKTLRTALKTAGIKKCSVNQVTQNYLMGMITLGNVESEESDVRTFLDVLINALRDAGVAPANTCAVTGAANPDSLCLITNQKFYGYQPVNATAIRQSGYEARAKAEENENNGSYLTGLLGAILGTLVGMVANLVTIVFAHRIYSLLFALIPMAAMFGYKLFKGKTNKVSIVIVCVLSILAVPTLELLTLAILGVKENDFTFSESLSLFAENFFDSELLKETGPEMLQFLLFMALGLFFSWGYVNGSLNSTQLQNTQAQLDSMRPNPNRQ